jgi:hypothetical protein
VNLDDTNEMNEAVRVFSRCSLAPGANILAIQSFLQSYTDARTQMLNNMLISDTDPIATRREIEEFKTKIEGSDLLTYLLELPRFPLRITSTDEADFGETLMGRCRQFVKARMKPGLTQKAGANSMLTSQEKTENKNKNKKG